MSVFASLGSYVGRMSLPFRVKPSPASVGAAPHPREHSLRGKTTLWALGGAAIALLAAGCTVDLSNVSPDPQEQSVLIYTPDQVARALSDPIVGDFVIGVTTPECGSEDLIPCPAKAYAPSDFLGKGGSLEKDGLAVDVAAGDYGRADVKQEKQQFSFNHVPNRFVPIRANVLVEGPKRLRAHVLELLRAMPPPSVHLGDIKVPQRQYYVHGADPTSSAG